MEGFGRFLSDEEGVTAMEYSLIAALIALGIIVAATAIGVNLTNVFNNAATSLAVK